MNHKTENDSLSADEFPNLYVTLKCILVYP
jgi:hypothetical protein